MTASYLTCRLNQMGDRMKWSAAMDMTVTKETKEERLHRFYNSAAFTIRQLYRIDYIVSNLMALALCGLIAILLQTKWLLPHSAESHHVFMIVLGILAGIQIIKSSFRSLLLPSICLVIGSIGIFIHHFVLFKLGLPVSLLQFTAAVGVLGICIAVLVIR